MIDTCFKPANAKIAGLRAAISGRDSCDVADDEIILSELFKLIAWQFEPGQITLGVG